MRRCPTCQRIYADDVMIFCLEDGTPLEASSETSSDESPTVKIPAARLTDPAPTEVMPEGALAAMQDSPMPASSQHAASSAPPVERKPNALPWILGAALVLGLSAIVVALIVTRGSGTDSSQIAQNTAQTENSAPSANSSPVPEPSAGAMTEKAANPVVSSGPTPANEASTKTQTSKTPEQMSATPKPTPTAKATPAPTPRQEPPSAPISGGVLNGKAISLPKPTYPPMARAVRASGIVTVQVIINESGQVTSARAVGGHPLLQQSAVKAAYGARFSPTQLSGQPVKVTGVITYNFVAQ